MRLGLISTCVAMSMAATSAQAGVCEWIGGGAAAAGTGVAVASTAAKAAGIAAVPFYSGGTIITSVGVGGTGYIAGTLGTIGAGALAIVSAPAVIVGAAAVAVAGGGTVAYCYLKD